MGLHCLMGNWGRSLGCVKQVTGLDSRYTNWYFKKAQKVKSRERTDGSMLICVNMGMKRADGMRVRGNEGISALAGRWRSATRSQPKQGTLAGGPRLSGVLAIPALV